MKDVHFGEIYSSNRQRDVVQGAKPGGYAAPSMGGSAALAPPAAASSSRRNSSGGSSGVGKQTSSSGIFSGQNPIAAMAAKAKRASLPNSSRGQYQPVRSSAAAEEEEDDGELEIRL